MVVRTQVTSFGFFAAATARSEGCKAYIDESDFNLIYTVEGSLEYDLNKHAGAGADKEPGNALKSDGWEKS